MTVRGVDYLENWIKVNVIAANQGLDIAKAGALATRCILEAAEQGISVEEMVTEWGSVESIIYDMLRLMTER
jgi:hypothetical protein